MARELLLTSTHGGNRQPVLLLILGNPPPIVVKGHGRLAVDEAIQLGLNGIEARLGRPVQDVATKSAIAYLTWSEISEQVRTASESYTNPDRSTLRTVQRIAAALIEAVANHS